MNERETIMDKIKKITAEEIRAAMKDYEPEAITIEWRGLEFIVKRTISFAEMAKIVETVTATCFSPEGEYMPVCRDFMWAHEIISAYTNLELPEDAEECCQIIYDADLFMHVIDHISSDQYGEMYSAIGANIRHKLNTDMQALKKSVQEITDSLAVITKATEGISIQDLNGLMNMIANGGIDEAKIVDAILNRESQDKE